jgi:SAM-dependent methyltransferase
MSKLPDWATQGGDVWARRWREIDSALSDLAPKLHSAILEAAPGHRFRALDIGCGAGATSEQLASDRPEAAIIACDLSPSLVQVARERLAHVDSVQVLLGDATAVAAEEGPFDLFVSRHGVMFFDSPVDAFRTFRNSAAPGASLVFSCFQPWAENPWASELASAAAGRGLPAPGREPSGFAFADPGYVREILEAAGWTDAEPRPAPFRYTAAAGEGAVEQALSFLGAIGPAARLVSELPEKERNAAVQRMRDVIERHFDGRAVVFPAAAWIWSAKAGAA